MLEKRPVAGSARPGQPTVPKETPPPRGIKVTDVYRTFGAVKAVNGASFEAKPGQVTALIGPNGSGKTTLMLILAGLLRPDSGVAYIDGRDIVKDNLAARTRVGWMPDSFGTWDALTCMEILSVAGASYGMTRATIRQRARDLLRRVYLSEYADEPARILSRGQLQRLGLARVLIHDPSVLLLDEPASGLDPRSRLELRDIVRTLAEKGKAVLVSSHVLSELEDVADHAVFLAKGATVAVGDDADKSDREWQMAALDYNRLTSFLNKTGVPWRNARAEDEVVVIMPSDRAVANLVKKAVTAGVPICKVAPRIGRLAHTYLQLNEERR